MTPLPKVTTVGRMLYEDIVPQEFREDDDGSPINADKVKGILQRVAEKKPELYREISHKLLKAGARASVETGSSFSLHDLKNPLDKQALLAEMRQREAAVFNTPGLSGKDRDSKLSEIYSEFSNRMTDEVYKASLAGDNNLAHMVASGARGSRGQLNSNIGFDGLVLDYKDRPIPVPIINSYAEGLSPAEYFASSYGTRKGLVATKLATADSGFFGKQLATAASDLVITEPDCGTSRGVQASTDDNDYVGTALAKDVGGYPAGTIVSPSILKEFRKTGVGSIPVRSASTCQAHSGGLCAKCAGIRERNRMPALMDNIGLAAASAVSEPLSQSQLATKHSAGVAGSTQNLVGGFKLINQLAQVPEVFQDKATVSEVDGPVTKVVDAPQGGKFVYVGQEEHYIPAEKNLKVRVGDQLEAGDVLSEGIVNPADVVRHKGIGEGRAYFVKTMQDAFSSSGIKTSKRNLEVLSRALINHVKISGDGAGDYLPDDIVNYSDFERSYQPREGAKEMDPREAQGHYLEKPVLHYSIGTRITPRVAKTLQDAQEIKVLTHPSPPVFEPQMVRLMEAGSSGKDWMAKMQGTGLKKNLMAEVQSGEAESDIHGLNPIPGIAKGTEFGKPPPGVVGY